MNNNNIFENFKTMLFIIAILWLILLLSTFVDINQLGIRPRTAIGLVGILLAPFLHANVYHLFANSISLFILGSIFISLENKFSLIITMHFIILGGFGTWLIGRANFVHIGASGVIYGIMGHLLFIGIFTRNLKTIIISLLVFIFYGGAVWGVLPGNSFISWESHLCGFLTGVLTAKLYSKRK